MHSACVCVWVGEKQVAFGYMIRHIVTICIHNLGFFFKFIFCFWCELKKKQEKKRKREKIQYSTVQFKIVVRAKICVRSVEEMSDRKNRKSLKCIKKIALGFTKINRTTLFMMQQIKGKGTPRRLEYLNDINKKDKQNNNI